MHLLRNPYLWAIAVRLALMLLVDRQLQGDASDYHYLAENIAAGNGFSRCTNEPFIPTALRPPLYPYLLGMIYKLGFNRLYVAIILNFIFDLASMRLARAWADAQKFKWASYVPWVIGLCPILITYSMYPTTENISVLLFFGALFETSRRRPVTAGLLWGLLSLCRPYYLLFPFAFVLFRPSRQWSLRAIAVLIAFSMVGPGIWVARNKLLLGKATFSHSAGVAWQSYQGVCFPNFEWWRPEHATAIMQHPVFSRLVSRAACSPLEDLEEIDAEGRIVVREWIQENPLLALRNIVIKGVMLFINWGQTMPYNRVSFLWISVANAFMCFFWWCAFRILRARKWGATKLDDSLKMALLNIGYVVAVTIPFAVDARYLLPPVLLLAICLLEIRRTPAGVLRAGLESPDAKS